MGLQIEKKGEYTKTRTYMTKKKGLQTKQYVYQRQSTLLFRKTTKGGQTQYKLIDKAWKEFEKKINTELRGVERTSTLNEARRIKNDILSGKTFEIAAGTSAKHYKSTRQKGWNRIDIDSMISRLAQDKAAKFLVNMGLDPVEVASRFDIALPELLNDGNWVQDTWNGSTNAGIPLTLKFHFDYNYDTNIEVI